MPDDYGVIYLKGSIDPITGALLDASGVDCRMGNDGDYQPIRSIPGDPNGLSWFVANATSEERTRLTADHGAVDFAGLPDDYKLWSVQRMTTDLETGQPTTKTLNVLRINELPGDVEIVGPFAPIAWG